MKKRIIYLSGLILISGLCISYFSKDKEYNNSFDNRTMAVYIENDEGNYVKDDNIPGRDDGYTLNTNKSVCNGNTAIGWDKEEWAIELNNIDREETKCYLYFDKYVPTASDIIFGNITIKDGTPNFVNAATTDEGIFEVEDGMYGGYSYYWRGAVTNNYVKFGGFCWRIVRINGDGSIRIIYDGSSCHANGTNTPESLAVTDQAYNSSPDRSEYVGYTYTTGSQRTLSGTASNLKIQNDTWYNNNIGNNATYLSKVADGKYCNDRNVASGYSWSSQPSSQFYYAGYDRSGAKSASSVSPTLSCPSGDVYTLKVGAITMDEVIMAGGKWATANGLYYLYNGQNYWIMSPYTLFLNGSDHIAYVFRVYFNGDLNQANVRGPGVGVRPVINLRSDITFSGGNGTLDNPYVVQ